MATFVLDRLDNLSGFYSSADMGKFLKPEEMGQAIVSQPLGFHILKQGLNNGVWVDFVEEFNRLVHRGVDLMEFDGDKDVEKNRYRVVIISASNPCLKEQVDEKPEVVRFPMKAKLISGIPLDKPRGQREQCCLAQLTKLCGHQNVNIVSKGMNTASRTTLKMSWNIPQKMSWNEEDLCWETDGQLSITKAEISQFGKKGAYFQVHIGKFELNLNNAAVARILQRLYGSQDNTWRLQKQLLEAGEFSDMEIISSSEGKRSIKCHRVHLAGASPFFAQMLDTDREKTDDGPSEAKRGKWKEAQTHIIKLSESEDAIKAMVHFLYYGGCERIFRNRVDIVLELLEAGQKYDIPSLKKVATFVLLTDAQEDNWFTVDAAMKLFKFSRLLEGKQWDHLKSKSVKALRDQPKDVLMDCPDYLELHSIAVKLGPVFVCMLEATEKHDFPKCFPTIGSNVSVQEAMAFFDWITSDNIVEYLCEMNVAAGVMILAEYCERPIPDSIYDKFLYQFLENDKLGEYEVDYLVDLFRYSRKKQAKFYKMLKMGALRFLQAMMVTEKEQVINSKKWKMLTKNPEAFEEFAWLCNMEFEGEIRKLLR